MKKILRFIWIFIFKIKKEEEERYSSYYRNEDIILEITLLKINFWDLNENNPNEIFSDICKIIKTFYFERTFFLKKLITCLKF